MGKKLYVGNLTHAIGQRDLERAFCRFGVVTSAVVVEDRMTGRSSGFGFVEMGSEMQARAAINGLHGSILGGRPLAVYEEQMMDSRGGAGDFARSGVRHGGGGLGGRGGVGSEGARGSARRY